jgi:hypothetical protein
MGGKGEMWVLTTRTYYRIGAETDGSSAQAQEIAPLDAVQQRDWSELIRSIWQQATIGESLKRTSPQSEGMLQERM